MRFSQTKTVFIELTTEEATYLRDVIQKYRDGDAEHSYMTGNEDEDEFVEKFLGYISTEV